MADTLKLDQYDDDLTIGLDDFNEEIYVDDDDLLRYQPPESPLTKLQSIVVAIDWEISDEILLQFNEEILALREVWADEKVYLVYLQALEQISKYIYQEKANVHPSAIKLLPLFFQNLEKISSPDFTDEEEKQAILISDVKRFNFLKKEISGHKGSKSDDCNTALQNLKALVLSIDWEVTEDDLGNLRSEVLCLEKAYSASKPRLILLQGIGTLAAYIQHKGGNADANGFRLLHDFYACLERLATSSFSASEEKDALLVEVEKFNAFKAKIAGTLSPEAIKRDEQERSEEVDEAPSSEVIVPAFSDVDPSESSGFQEDVVAEKIGDSEELSNKISEFFPEDNEESSEEEGELPDVAGEAESRLDDFFGDEMTAEEKPSERELALQGVAVEIDDEDDDDEDDSLLSGEDSPAFIAQETPVEESAPLAFTSETEAQVENFFSDTDVETPGKAVEDRGDDFLNEDDIESRLNSFFGDDEDEEVQHPGSGEAPIAGLGEAVVSEEVVAQNVSNTEAGDDFLNEDDIESRLNNFFGDDTEEPQRPGGGEGPIAGLEENVVNETALAQDASTAEAGDDFLNEDDIESRLNSFFGDDEVEEPKGPVAALSGDAVGNTQAAETVLENDDLGEEGGIEATLDSFFEDFGDDIGEGSSPVTEQSVEEEAIAPALAFVEGEEESELAVSGSQEEGEQEPLLSVGLEDTLGDFFTEDDDVKFSETPEEELFADDLFAEDDTLESGASDDFESTGVAASALGVAAIAGVAATTNVLSEDETGKELADDSDTDSVGAVAESGEDLVAPLLTEASDNVFEEVSEDTQDDFLFAEQGGASNDSASSSFDAEKVEADDELTSEHDPLIFTDIRGSISSLSFDLNEMVIDAVLKDIESLRMKLSDDPIASSFLQLMHTLSQHIQRYQYQTSSAVFTMLMEIHEALESSFSLDLASRQNSLLAETYKVLQWQQELIDSREQSGESAEPVMPIVAEQKDDELFSEGEDELIYAAQEETTEGKEHDVESLRGELKELRLTLQDELASLRRDLTER